MFLARIYTNCSFVEHAYMNRRAPNPQTFGPAFPSGDSSALQREMSRSAQKVGWGHNQKRKLAPATAKSAWQGASWDAVLFAPATAKSAWQELLKMLQPLDPLPQPKGLGRAIWKCWI